MERGTNALRSDPDKMKKVSKYTLLIKEVIYCYDYLLKGRHV